MSIDDFSFLYARCMHVGLISSVFDIYLFLDTPIDWIDLCIYFFFLYAIAVFYSVFSKDAIVDAS